MTIGATRTDVLWLIVREQVHGVLIGLVTGGLIAAWAIRYVQSYLYETQLADPFVWSASALLLVAVALAGALVPASRASCVDPVRALRVE